MVYFLNKNKLSHNIIYTAAPPQFRHVELYFWCGIIGISKIQLVIYYQCCVLIG